MINILLTILKTAVAVLPFVLFCFYSRRVNLEKQDRAKQFFMPVIALIYVVVVMIFVDKINAWLLWVIDSIPYWLEGVGTISWMPGFIVSAAEWLAANIRKLNHILNLNYWIFYISNIVILVGYLIIKRLIIALLGKVIKEDSKLYGFIATRFYEHVPEVSRWCLKTSLTQSRSLLRMLYIAVTVITSTLFIACGVLYKNDLLKGMFYPVVAVITTGELFFYLDGITRGEYLDSIRGEDEDAFKTVNYTPLREYLKNLFADKLLTDNTGTNDPGTDLIPTDVFAENLEASDSDDDNIFAEYVKVLNSSGKEINRDYISSSIELLHGNSILFNNPFYRDLIPYAFYPMNKALLNHGKVLVILGRHGVEEDVIKWLADGIEAITGMPMLWTTQILSKEGGDDPDIGIITRSNILDVKLHRANADFLSKVRFCFILEPSKLVTTAQVGLNLLVKSYLNSEDKKTVYCLCDKNCDGLVDAMSHILMTNLTEITPTRKYRGTSSYMCWSPDDEDVHHRLVPNISRYLGFGTELSLVALKNQVERTYWYGGEAFPVTDINWISQQYYYDLTKYAGLPQTLEAMNDGIKHSSYMWSAPEREACYITVEDESNNMFEVLRDFSTRSTDNGFVNIISPDYMLKDYMSENAEMFGADAKAIPYISADFVRTERNFILRLLLGLCTFPMFEKQLEKEFSLFGISVFNLKNQLWYELYKCFAAIDEIAELPEDYKEAVKACSKKKITAGGKNYGIEIIVVADTYNFEVGEMEKEYSIVNKDFIRDNIDGLKFAQYVVEDEKSDENYLGAELLGHIYQRHLPNQFFTFNGKYYEMLYLTANNQVLVRRAADHINGRPAYRQIRRYNIKKSTLSTQIGAVKSYSGTRITKEFVDFEVQTDGYYEMHRYGDFSNAKRVIFEGEKTGIPKREFRSKEVLRIELPDNDGSLNDDVRYTLTIMMNELFRTIFAENAPFIAALTDTSFMEEKEDADSKEVSPLTYTISGEEPYYSKNSIYIVEDSQLDLGLTVAVERNFERILQILDDYIDWHNEMLENSLVPPEEETERVFDLISKDKEPPKKPGFFKRIAQKVKSVFTKKNKDDGKRPGDKDRGAVPQNIGGSPDEDGDLPPAADGVNGNPAPAAEGEAAGTAAAPVNADGKPLSKKELRKLKKEEKKKAKELKKEQKKKEKEQNGTEKKPGFFTRIANLFKRKKKPGKETPPEMATDNPETPAETGINEIPGEITDAAVDTETAPEEGFDEVTEEDSGADCADEPDDKSGGTADTQPDKLDSPPPEDQISESVIAPSEKEGDGASRTSIERKPYHQRYYFLYGKDKEPAHIDLISTKKYLQSLNLGNSLKPTRNSMETSDAFGAMFDSDDPGAKYCDFCGGKIYGIEYETLADGRERCTLCGKTAIKTESEFKRLFAGVKHNMEVFFGININAGIIVEMVNSKKLHKKIGKSFVPTKHPDSRVLGVAINDKNGFRLLVEHGSPRFSTALTIAHELTHIWQYLNWDKKAIKKKYGKRILDEVYEGMAKWVEVQYAYLINEKGRAKREYRETMLRDDEYGRGFIRYVSNYPLSLGSVITKATPFQNPDAPLDDDYLGAVSLPDKDSIGAGPGAPRFPKKDGAQNRSAGADSGPADRDPSNVMMFAYGQLSDEEKAVYDALYENIVEFEPVLDELPEEISKDSAFKVIKYIQTDHPELFWFQGSSSVRYGDDETVTEIELHFTMTREEADRRRAEIDESIAPFLSSIDDKMSDYAAALKIYENIIDLIDYDSLGLKSRKHEDENTPDDLRSIYGVFVNKKAVCSGYAKATQYLLNKLGIPCTYVTSETHAWNLVYLEGDYYYIDTTWGDPSNTETGKEESDKIRYRFFCITTRDLSRLKEHTPDGSLELPECTAIGCNYYNREGLYFESADEDRLRGATVDGVSGGKYTVSVRCSCKEVYDKLIKEQIEDKKFFDIIKYAGIKCKINLSQKYTYSCSDDLFVITFNLEKA